jgi:excisionase family DNA binding protein
MKTLIFSIYPWRYGKKDGRYRAGKQRESNERHRSANHNDQNGRDKRLFNMKEAAVYLGRSEWGVRRLIWGGHLPEIRLGRRVQVDVRDLDDFIERNRVGG